MCLSYAFNSYSIYFHKLVKFFLNPQHLKHSASINSPVHLQGVWTSNLFWIFTRYLIVSLPDPHKMMSSYSSTKKTQKTGDLCLLSATRFKGLMSHTPKSTLLAEEELFDSCSWYREHPVSLIMLSLRFLKYIKCFLMSGTSLQSIEVC